MRRPNERNFFTLLDTYNQKKEERGKGQFNLNTQEGGLELLSEEELVQRRSAVGISELHLGQFAVLVHA